MAVLGEGRADARYQSRARILLGRTAVIVSLHVATGAAAGAASRSRLAALLLGPILHLAGDRLPHQDFGSRRFEIASGVAGILLLAARRGPLDPATLGAAASSAPDLEHVFPFLRPVTLAALIIIGHISIKVFDLIVAIGGKQIVTEVPAIYMWVLIYDARDYAKGAAIATLLLLGISILIIPYLVFTVRQERRT